MEDLAIFGGPAALAHSLRPYRSIGEEERLAVDRVMRSGVLSGFVGAWCDEFWGGPEITAFEAAWRLKFRCKHALSVNSNTSGMIAALGAVGVGPGDEVIVPPYTMSATAVVPLFYGAVPVFADIESETFCLDPAAVEAAISPRTRAIIAVNLFGHPAALSELRGLADRRGIYLIEDNAQGPLASEDSVYCGTIGHIGVFSLNYHKHIHTGEGGVCTTNDDMLAKRMAAIRNHAENVPNELGLADLTNLVGFNFRMTELSAAIGVEQLRKAESLVAGRERIADRMTAALRDLPGLVPPMVRPNCRHVYYVWSIRYDEAVMGVPRDMFARALAAEGFPVSQGYVEPLYMLPLFQKRIAIGSGGFPFTLSNRSYAAGLCPIAERMHRHELVEFHICSYEVNDDEIDALIAAVRKVHARRADLKRLDV